MVRKKKEPETTTIEWEGPHLIPTTELLKQENENLKECIRLLVSYLDAPVKARSKLTDIERMLEQ